MNFANNVIIRDASGIFRSKREVISLLLEGLDATSEGKGDREDNGDCVTNDGEVDSEDNWECVQQVKLQITFLTDEIDDEDDEEAEVGNLFDDLQLANEQHRIQIHAIMSTKIKSYFGKK